MFDPHRGFHAAWPGGPPAEVVYAANQAAAQRQQQPYRPVTHLCRTCRGHQVANATDLCPSCGKAEARRHSEPYRQELSAALFRDARTAAATASRARVPQDFTVTCSTKTLLRTRQETVLSGWLLQDRSSGWPPGTSPHTSGTTSRHWRHTPRRSPPLSPTSGAKAARILS
ncbi:hypothetical protein [Phytohabitans rumicis]|uniref:Uncharacterized protein n=1 Tax=Phytohabitans rumicis TaxID=1076125 RepID=A0A6V8LGB0_9ACTN|nr:hypothetical protein [Phytohabitans rumicis]GFJ93928.1 hypothetical protein Prum_075700 [Phytohabitans rumicis]